ncbi:MAG: hypothetical protein ACOH5I_22775 [Oligoflexus sp.]
MKRLNFPWFSLLIGGISVSYLIATAPQRIDHILANRKIFSPPPLSQLNSKLVNILTLGHKHVYDDFINIWLLQTLVESDKPPEPDRMMDMIRSVIKHHPQHETLYMLSCYVMIQDFSRPENCQEIILEGLQAFPESWRLPVQQGYVHAFLTKQPAQAASFFMLASSRKNAPPWVPGAIERLLSQEGISESDLTSSLQIMESQPEHSSFIEMLKRLQKFSPQ